MADLRNGRVGERGCASVTTLDRYVVISADGHAGNEIHGYRDYLERAFLDEFDAWVADYVCPFPDLEGPNASRNWDSDRRLADLEADGIVAEVLFPNTVPPFYPKSSLTAHPPTADAHELALRWAGLRGAQPLARRLLRRDTRSARGDRADPARRRRRGGRGDPLGPRRGPHRRRAPPGRASGHRAPPALLTGVRPDLAGVRGARDAGEPPLGQRGAADGRDERRQGGLPARGDVVGAPRVLAPRLRWCARAVPADAARLHGAGHGLDPGGAPPARLLLRPHEVGTGIAGGRVGRRGGREARAPSERVLGAPVPRRRELHPPGRGAAARRRRRRQDHVGQRLPAQGVELPVLARGAAALVRRRARP